MIWSSLFASHTLARAQSENCSKRLSPLTLSKIILPAIVLNTASHLLLFFWRCSYNPRISSLMKSSVALAFTPTPTGVPTVRSYFLCGFFLGCWSSFGYGLSVFMGVWFLLLTVFGGFAASLTTTRLFGWRWEVDPSFFLSCTGGTFWMSFFREGHVFSDTTLCPWLRAMFLFV